MTDVPSAPMISVPSALSPTPVARLLLLWIVGVGIAYNNVLRWYPFPAGRSANDLTGLESNLAGIIVNVAIYGSLLLVGLFSGATQQLTRRSRLLQTYCLFLAIQAPFRADAVNEIFRSFAMIAMLLSADWLAAIVTGSPQYATAFLRRMWLVMVATIFVGLVIGVLFTDSVNWGYGLSTAFQNQNRAEFFFFYVLPHYTFALSLAIIIYNSRRPGVLFVIATTAVILIIALSGLTATRTITFSLLLIAVIFLFCYARRMLVVGAIAVIVVAGLWPGAISVAASQLRVAELFSTDPTVDATNGRLFLVLTNLQSFADSPVFGQGAVEARRRVEESGSIARTEHGYSIHLASSGIFAFALLAYVLEGMVAGVRILFTSSGRPQNRRFGPYGIAIASLAAASFVTGFVWTFSSATSFYDWMAVFFVSSARVLWQISQEPSPPPQGLSGSA